VTSALLHGGTSTVYALGHPPAAEHWKVAIGAPERPTASAQPPRATGPQPASAESGRIMIAPLGRRPDSPPALLATVPLRDESLSVSEISGRHFQIEGQSFGHVLDPRSGQPVAGNLLAAVVLPSATETDALSTALLILGPAGHDRLAALRPGMRTLLATESGGALRVETRGLTVHPGLA
jgi:FAD:protein FMN transferase